MKPTKKKKFSRGGEGRWGRNPVDLQHLLPRNPPRPWVLHLPAVGAPRWLLVRHLRRQELLSCTFPQTASDGRKIKNKNKNKNNSKNENRNKNKNKNRDRSRNRIKNLMMMEEEEEEEKEEEKEEEEKEEEKYILTGMGLSL